MVMVVAAVACVVGCGGHGSAPGSVPRLATAAAGGDPLRGGAVTGAGAGSSATASSSIGPGSAGPGFVGTGGTLAADRQADELVAVIGNSVGFSGVVTIRPPRGCWG
jgi:hypothetical protein